jgi:hypothetical protein
MSRDICTLYWNFYFTAYIVACFNKSFIQRNSKMIFYYFLTTSLKKKKQLSYLSWFVKFVPDELFVAFYHNNTRPELKNSQQVCDDLNIYEKYITSKLVGRCESCYLRKYASRLGVENPRKLIISQSFVYQTLTGQYGLILARFSSKRQFCGTWKVSFQERTSILGIFFTMMFCF